ncbi:putative aminophospholipid translocase [Leptomonas seymouri]|uniref:Phospholipid-transporting ATPase n=1 Tax=Leptomonas seymouri TaxID=5684 RepID=A0A0N0P450_LEPSE|nr:putative aminophospholipid translocase [Leptomonas seymouri]|eukprot:KPI84886.1 putative aminophospholipid translocase [Leptomonas seymouri]
MRGRRCHSGSSEMRRIRYNSLSCADTDGGTISAESRYVSWSSNQGSPLGQNSDGRPDVVLNAQGFAATSAATVLSIPPLKKLSFRYWLRELLHLPIPPSTEYRHLPFGYFPGEWAPVGYPSNAVNNRRSTILTFLPLALLHQFQSFFNLFYLFLAFSQFIPVFKVGFLFTYFSPLLLVVCLSLLKDALDEWKRFRRDHIANVEVYEKLTRGGEVVPVKSADIKVGDLLLLHHDQRVPADCVVLHTSDKAGITFIRTDQLDGETDWKLRYPLRTTKSLSYSQLSCLRFDLNCDAPHKDIYSFAGTLDTANGQSESMTLESVMWASCVVATGTVVAAVVYTGRETRSALNSTNPRNKSGLIESELNRIATLCFSLLVILSLLLVAQQHFRGDAFVMLIRFFILLSAIIPISMRVNVDVARLWYSYDISHDHNIPGTVARNTDLSEELGRLHYLFSDKTGTLTKNKMQFRVMQVGPATVLTDRDKDRLSYVAQELFGAPSAVNCSSRLLPQSAAGSTFYDSNRLGPAANAKHWIRDVQAVGELIKAIVLCHNVSPVFEEEFVDLAEDIGGMPSASSPAETHQQAAAVSSSSSPPSMDNIPVDYQASSPDEVALVKFCSSLGVVLTYRDLNSMAFTVGKGAQPHTYTIVKMFPFSSERRCMGIILRERSSSGTAQESIKFYMKGADVKMATVVRKSEWMDECCQELAQMGLRTLVFASRVLSAELLEHFLREYEAATGILGEGRTDAIESAMRLIEVDMTLTGVTGVEDELQDEVVVCLETLGMCGIKVWMLTGDKVETATTIGRSTRLIPRHGRIEYLCDVSPSDIGRRLHELHEEFCCDATRGGVVQQWTLVLDGTALSYCLTYAPFFAEIAGTAYSVIVARCSPTQKAAVVKMMRNRNREVRVAAIGDGGNDVSMIQAANVGLGIEGVEGKQASMAADFSITKFSHCLRLIMWHGRNSYRRTCRLSQFIMHRGIVYSVVQTVFSVLFAGTTMSVFNGYLLMGYSTVFTMVPAFALALDEDFKESDVHEYPFLYKDLLKSRFMNTRTFLQWVWASFFQGGVMMLVALQLFSEEMFQIVTIAYTSLLITELAVIGATVHLCILWRERRLRFFLFLGSEVLSLVVFFLAVIVLPDTFDRVFFFSWSCWWRVAVICLASIGPLMVFRLIGEYILFNPRIAVSFFGRH